MSLVDALVQMPALLYIATGILGLVIGSFLNVVILRLPKIMQVQWRRECAELADDDTNTDGESADRPAPAGDKIPGEPFNLAYPPSHCPACGHRIGVLENIPVLSFLWLRARCSACRAPISWRYPLIEVLTAVLTLLVIWHFGPTAQGLLALILTWGLIALAGIDFDTELLPDAISLPLLWLGLLASLAGVFVDSRDAIIGAAAGYSSLWLVYQLFRMLTGKEGMGYGDFKLLSIFGAWFGWTALPQILLLSTIPGALFGIGLVLSGRSERQTPFAFGPFLAIAGWIYLIWGERIAHAYMDWSGLA